MAAEHEHGHGAGWAWVDLGLAFAVGCLIGLLLAAMTPRARPATEPDA